MTLNTQSSSRKPPTNTTFTAARLEAAQGEVVRRMRLAGLMDMKRSGRKEKVPRAWITWLHSVRSSHVISR